MWKGRGEGSSANTIPLEDVPGGNQASETTDRENRKQSISLR